MIQVSVGKNHRLNTTRVEVEALLAQARNGIAALMHAAIEQIAPSVQLQLVTGSGYFLCRSERGNDWHAILPVSVTRPCFPPAAGSHDAHVSLLPAAATLPHHNPPPPSPRTPAPAAKQRTGA